MSAGDLQQALAQMGVLALTRVTPIGPLRDRRGSQTGGLDNLRRRLWLLESDSVLPGSKQRRRCLPVGVFVPGGSHGFDGVGSAKPQERRPHNVGPVLE